MALRYLYATATQGSADAFVQTSISTALSGLTREVLDIRELVIGWPALSVATIAGARVAMALTRVSFAAECQINDLGVVMKWDRINRFTTSGHGWGPLVERFTFGEGELLLAEDPIYFQLDSDATSASNVARIRIGYEIARVTEVERLALRLDSLAAS